MSRWSFKKSKQKPLVPLPRPPEPFTARDAIREAYRSAGALDILKKIRNTPTNLERELTALGLSTRLASQGSKREQKELEAAISGLLPGKTAGTLPERLVGAWLVRNNYQFGGVGPTADLGRDWSFQVPLEGGRSQLGGGTVVDFFLSAQITGTDLGVLLYEDGAYWHKQPDTVVRDRAQRLHLELLGYKVARIMDYEALDSGLLDTRMREIINGFNYGW